MIGAMQRWSEQTIRAMTAEEIARRIRESVPAMTLTCRGDCVHCIQRRQAVADAVLALEIGGEPLTVARGEAAYTDSIMAWSGVRQGDWAVYLGQLEQVGGAMDDPADTKRVAVLISGSWRNPLRDDLTAVRRHTGTGG